MSRIAKAMLFGLLTAIFGLLASLTPTGFSLEEDLGLGLLFSLRGVREAPGEVVIVAIDKASADKLKQSEKADRWPRSLHALLTETLAREGAAVIAFDLLFEDIRSVEEDKLFAAAMKNAGNVVLCRRVRREALPLPNEEGKTPKGFVHIETLAPLPALFAEVALGTAPFPLPKVPVKVSEYWTFKTSAGETPTLPVVILQAYALEAYEQFVHLLQRSGESQLPHLPPDRKGIGAVGGIENLVRTIRALFQRNPGLAQRMLNGLRDERAASDGDGRRARVLSALIRMYQSPDSLHLNFYGPPATVATIPYYQVLQPEKDPHSRPDVRGKAVFVGLSERFQLEQKDGFHTVFSQPNGLDLTGVEIAATAFANLLEDRAVRPLHPGVHAAIVILWGVFLGLACRFLRTILGAIVTILASALYLFLASSQFQSAGLWYPLVAPLFIQAPLAFLGAVSWKYFETHREREAIRGALGYCLPAKVVDDIARNMTDITSGGQIVYGTCLCTDADQYTALSEIMDPKELGGLLNRYYQAVFEPVRRRGGIVSDVVGDCMMAIWATTQPDAALRQEACLAALEINHAVRRFHEMRHGPELPTRIGLHSGHMLLGGVGAIDHYEYRAVGDIVNTVSRIENLNKHLGTRILVSAEVLSELDGFLTRDLGTFLLSGKSKPIAIHELLGRQGETDERQRHFCALFAQGLDAYRGRSWAEAIKKFCSCVELLPGDGPALLYVGLCERHSEIPPADAWDGAIAIGKT